MLTATRPPQLKSVLIASGLVLTLAMGVRHGFGFWLQPISQAHGWTRRAPRCFRRRCIRIAW